MWPGILSAVKDLAPWRGLHRRIASQKYVTGRYSWLRRLVFSIFLITLPGLASAAPSFPELTGRIVDNAHVLSPGAVQYLTQRLADYENGTGNQVVVAIVPSLQNDSIEDYGNQLFRHWGLGQKGKDNGVLLLIAPNERHVHIEVGYRLEPILTDAASSEIIHGVILPAFKDGNRERGIINGTQAILSVLGGHAIHRDIGYGQQQATSPFQTFLAIMGLILFLIFAVRHPFLTMLLLSNSRFGSSGGSGWGNDNFRGGGGSAGGGGASGSW